jgi:hypothetical protein
MRLENVPPIVTRTGGRSGSGEPGGETRLHGVFAALENVMRVLREPFDYDYLMGVSGNAFRTIIHEEGVYCEPPEDGDCHFYYHALQGIGYRERLGEPFCRRQEDSMVVEHFARESLEAGVPVIVGGPGKPWGTVIGHEDGRFIVNVADGGTEAVDEIAAPYHIIRKGDPVRPAEEVRRSFSVAAYYAFLERMPSDRWKWFSGYLSGLEAYDAWITHLRTGRVGDEGSNSLNYLALVDAREAGLRYLHRVRRTYSGDVLRQLKDLASKYEMIVHLLRDNTDLFPGGREDGLYFSAAADVLQEVRRMEEDAFMLMRDGDLSKA